MQHRETNDVDQLTRLISQISTSPVLRRNFQPADLKIVYRSDRHYHDRHFSEAFELVEVATGNILGAFATHQACLEAYMGYRGN